MHTVQVVHVKALDGAGAITAAQECAEQASWSDWCEVGGSSDGMFDGATVLSVSDSPAAARTALTNAQSAADASFDRHRRALTGAPFTLFDVPRLTSGLSVNDANMWVERVNSGNAYTSDEWREVLAKPSLWEGKRTFLTATFHARHLCKLADFVWNSESAFYSVEFGPDVRPLLERVAAAELDPSGGAVPQPGDEGDFLVAVDFHY